MAASYPSYDAKIRRIEEIINRLQKEDLALEEAIKLYEEAQGLIQECEDFLSSLEQKYFRKEEAKLENNINFIKDVSIEREDT